MIGSHQITIHNQQKMEFLVDDQRFTMFFFKSETASWVEKVRIHGKTVNWYYTVLYQLALWVYNTNIDVLCIKCI